MTGAVVGALAEWRVTPGRPFRLADLPYDRSIPGRTHDRAIDAFHRSLQAIQQAYFATGDRAVIVFEGWDAAGKGGTIRRLTAAMDPRAFHVWPIGAPIDREKGKHYLFRFWQRLPDPGTIAIFDRSWYGRVLVERVEGLATEVEWRRAYDEINGFERVLTDDGVRVVKFYLHIDPEEQLKRFRSRLENPYKRWKLSYEDFRNRRRWSDYVAAVEEMVSRTSTEAAPWVVIPANDKKYARVNAIGGVVDVLAAGVDLSPRLLSPEVAAEAEAELGVVVPPELVARSNGTGGRKLRG